MISNLAILYTHHIDRLKLNFFAGRLNTKNRSPMCPVIGLKGCHLIPVRALPMYLRPEIRKGFPDRYIQLFYIFFTIASHARLRGMIDEVISKQFVKEDKIIFPLYNNFLYSRHLHSRIYSVSPAEIARGYSLNFTLSVRNVNFIT